MNKNMTPAERETVMLTSDADGLCQITTYQRSVMTKLDKNPSATVIERGFFGRHPWAAYEIPSRNVIFRTKVRDGAD